MTVLVLLIVKVVETLTADVLTTFEDTVAAVVTSEEVGDSGGSNVLLEELATSAMLELTNALVLERLEGDGIDPSDVGDVNDADREVTIGFVSLSLPVGLMDREVRIGSVSLSLPVELMERKVKIGFVLLSLPVGLNGGSGVAVGGGSVMMAPLIANGMPLSG